MHQDDQFSKILQQSITQDLQQDFPCIQRMKQFEQCYAMDFCKIDQSIFAAGCGSAIKIWKFCENDKFQFLQTLQGLENLSSLESITFSKHTYMFISGGTNHWITMWDKKGMLWGQVRRLYCDAYKIEFLFFYEKTFILAGSDQKIEILSNDNDNWIRFQALPKQGQVVRIQINATEQQLALGTNNSIVLFHLMQNKVWKKIQRIINTRYLAGYLGENKILIQKEDGKLIVYQRNHVCLYEQYQVLNNFAYQLHVCPQLFNEQQQILVSSSFKQIIIFMINNQFQGKIENCRFLILCLIPDGSKLIGWDVQTKEFQIYKLIK